MIPTYSRNFSYVSCHIQCYLRLCCNDGEYGSLKSLHLVSQRRRDFLPFLHWAPHCTELRAAADCPEYPWPEAGDYLEQLGLRLWGWDELPVNGKEWQSHFQCPSCCHDRRSPDKGGIRHAWADVLIGILGLPLVSLFPSGIHDYLLVIEDPEPYIEMWEQSSEVPD